MNIANATSRDKVLSKSRKEEASEDLSTKINDLTSEIDELKSEMKGLGTKMDAILSAFAKSV